MQREGERGMRTSQAIRRRYEWKQTLRTPYSDLNVFVYSRRIHLLSVKSWLTATSDYRQLVWQAKQQKLHN